VRGAGKLTFCIFCAKCLLQKKCDRNLFLQQYYTHKKTPEGYLAVRRLSQRS